MDALISIHALLAESDSIKPIFGKIDTNFYPRSPCGERPGIGLVFLWWGVRFLSTLSLRRATRQHSKSNSRRIRFLSTLSLRRATTSKHLKVVQIDISIHALLAESDPTANTGSTTSDAISIHALLAESDVEKVPADVYYQAFLSTLSLRRATIGLVFLWWGVRFLSTLSLRRATNDAINGCNPDFISIHALLAESDRKINTSGTIKMISIHALLAESDQLYINRTAKAVIFLSTLSLRRATNQSGHYAP